jgi:Na+/proline symporter
MAFEKYTTEQLKKYQKILLISSIIALVIMCFALGIALYQISNQKDSNLIYLIPTVFGPLAIFPSLFSASIGSEIKKRGGNS